MSWLDDMGEGDVVAGGGDFPTIATARHRWNGSDISTMWEDEARTTPASAGSIVGSWLDTISGAYLYNPNDAQKPSINAAGDGLTFDATGLILGVPKADLAWITSAGRNVRIFAIVEPTTLTGGRHIFGAAWFRLDYALVFAVAKLAHILRGATPSITSTADISTGLQLSEGEFDNTGNIGRVVINNGVRTDTGVKTTDIAIAASTTMFTMGAADGSFSGSTAGAFVGDIKELVMTEEMTAEEHTALMAYFSSTYGLSL